MGVDRTPGRLPLVLGIPADGRTGSADLAVLRTAEERLSGSARTARFPLCADLPECRSADGPVPPRLVRELYRAVAAADALLISAAEDGGPPPPRLLSALDWAGYPFGGVLTGTPAAVIGAGAEPAGGGVRARLRAVLRAAGARVPRSGALPGGLPRPLHFLSDTATTCEDERTMTGYFEPVSVGALKLPNRLLMAPMTRSRAPRGIVGPATAEYYAQRAAAGLIIAEGIQPSVRGQGYIDTPGLHSADQVAAWREVTGAVHAAGGRIFAQIMHSGRIGHPVLYPDGGLPVAPSAIASGERLYTPDGLLEHPVPRALATAEIEEVVDEFTEASRNAIDAGFDGVELHGSNGYLIQQFLADGTNRRTDRYGGSRANRIRFAAEVAAAVAEAIGPERTGMRIGPGTPNNGITESDTAELYPELARALAPIDLAYLHIAEEGHREVTEAVRAAWPNALLLNPHPDPASGARTTESGAEALAAGLADAITIGSEWLANPDLDVRVKAGGPFNDPDPATFYGGGEQGYTDYPRLDALQASGAGR
ncbi:NAD(P)H-dependent oxidoreductase [Nocardiopsis sp. CNT-189]|uniref:oxidoreductase n=1 Tax=Nocardiopsis oceanisediminis TaxID=2816862 RepID=UPI003B2E4DCE